MGDKNSKDLGFLIEVYEEYEVECAPPYDDQSDTHLSKVGNYFMVDTSKENVEARIRKHVPSSDKYKINIRQVEREIDDIYSLGEIDHPRD